MEINQICLTANATLNGTSVANDVQKKNVANFHDVWPADPDSMKINL